MKTAGPRTPGPEAPAARYAALDGLRGLAILMVLFVHFIGDEKPIGALEGAMVKLSNYGIWGVDLFFVLSGFLITGILYDAKRAPHYFRNFYVRRTLRIFPLYFGVLFLLFGVLPLLPVPYPARLAESARHQAWLWTYTSNVYLASARAWALPYVGHFWSLAVEEHFYLVWPIVVLVSSRSTLLRVCALCTAFALGLRIALSFAGAGDVALVVLTPGRLDALCVGAALSILVRDVGIERAARLTRPALFALPALVLLTSIWNATTGSLRDVVLPLRGTLVGLAFGAALLASLVAPRTGVAGRVLHSGALRFLGKYSYGVYVFHGIIAFAFQQHHALDALAERLGSHLGAMVLQAVVGAAASLLVAIGSYEIFEKPFLQLKDRFAPSVRPVAAEDVPHPPPPPRTP